MNVAVTGSPAIISMRQQSLRVLVVDDSAVIRGMIARWISAEPDLLVAGSVRTGLDAVNQIEQINPDIVVLDIEMPELDGISALPKLLAKKPNLIVIMASTLTRRNAEISFKALSLGASDYIPKPESVREAGAAEIFRRDLLQKIRHLGARVRRVDAPGIVPRMPVKQAVAPIAASGHSAALVTRRFGSIAPRVLLIGSSTGGPQALMTLMASLGPVIDRVPVLITQHMPPTFTTILAEHLARTSGRPAREAVDGEVVMRGHIYLAPGGRHMRVVRHTSGAAIALDDGPQINFCRPAVDPLFSSATDIWQSAALAVILTGMGSDGMRGAQDLVAAGGSVIAQDEASSVVWGMPGAAAHAGVCAAILPLNQIAPKLVRLFSGDRT